MGEMPSHTHPVPPAICPNCDSLLRFRADPATRFSTPQPGDITFCIHCANALTFNDRLQMVQVTVREIEDNNERYPGFSYRYTAALKAAIDGVKARDQARAERKTSL